jgi:stage III sporulation protein AE
VALLATLTGLILVSAILGRLREGLGGQSGELFGFCLRLTLFTAIIAQVSGTVAAVQDYLKSLSELTSSMIPVMGVLYALGGDMGRAAVNSEILGVFLVILQYISGSVTPPVCGICTVFSSLDAIGARALLAPLREQIKRWYATLLGVVTFLFSLALSTQSVLASRGDSLGMKGIKYAVGSMIPMVGGAIAGTLSTVAAGVSALRGICGVSGIILVVLLLFPTLVELLLLRAVLSLAAAVASMLSCEGEAKLLREMVSLQGYLIAAVSLCSVIFLLALALMTGCVSALAK